MKCEYCGCEVKNTDRVCSHCGAKISVNNAIQVQENNYQNTNEQRANYQNIDQQNSYNQTGKKQDFFENPDNLTALSAILFFAMPLLSAFFASFGGAGKALSGLFGCSPLAGFILMIYIRVKFPEHKGGKILMIAMIVLTIIYIVIFLLIIATCMSVVSQFK